MKPPPLLPGLAFSVLAAAVSGLAGEARVAVYVVDRAAEFAESGGACLPYTGREAPGPDREILALAQGPPGSTVLMVAFEQGTPYLGLAPVVAAQGGEAKPARFPAAGASWPFVRAQGPVELHVAVFHSADPDLERIAEYAEWLGDALREKDEVGALLHAEAIQKRLANLLRQRHADDYRVRFGDTLTSIRLPPSSKAAITRGGAAPAADAVTSEAKSPAVAIRRGFKTLDDEWLADSRVLPVEPATPGVLVFPISAPPVP